MISDIFKMLLRKNNLVC